ncbi:MAG: hypothetical protein J5642_01980 [Bacteroidales bacterium]|nr:hypothetical protein [Bacteroidales bacterium]
MRTPIFSALILSVLFLFSSCNKDWETAELAIPHYDGDTSDLRTIQDIIDVYTAAGGLDSICHRGDHFIVKATVVSSDEGGNLYKKMIVQDATGALEIPINRTGLQTTYPVGQTVFIDCQGLVVGNYHGVYQIGWIYQGAVGRIDANYLDLYLHKDGLPKDITPMITNITSPADINDGNVCKIVRIQNCHFAADAIGRPWAEETHTTSRAIETINGESLSAAGINLITYTSNYAKFRKLLVPDGIGDLTGILSVYTSGAKKNYQLLLCTTEDIHDFGAKTDIYPVLVNSQFNSDNTQWQEYNSYMIHRNVDTECEDWLVSPIIPIQTVGGAEFTVEEMFYKTGQVLQNYCFKVFYTTDNGSTWTELTPETRADDGQFHENKYTGLENVTQDFRIGFRFDGPCNDYWGIRKMHFYKTVPGTAQNH